MIKKNINILSTIFDLRARRFASTGLLVTGTHLILAIILIQFFYISSTVANSIAFTTSTAISYFLNTTWSFSKKIQYRTLAKFFTVSLLGLLITMLISFYFQEYKINYLLGIFLAALTIPPMSYTLHSFWTYK